jgi:hypothetical protein
MSWQKKANEVGVKQEFYDKLSSLLEDMLEEMIDRKISDSRR